MTSICMASYNGARFIKEQIDSILPQLAPDDELVISDDGSTDGTLEIIAEYAADPRVRVLHHEKKGNKFYPTLKLCYSTSNFENALKHALGDYIFLSDQDDVWEKDKVEKSLELLKEYDYIVHNFSVIDSEGKIVHEKYYHSSPLTFLPLIDIIHPNFWGCCSCFNRKILKKSVPFMEKVPQHDTWIGLVSEKYGSCFWNKEPLLRHRIYEGNTSTGSKKSENSFFLKILYRINTLAALQNLQKEQSK